MKNEVKVHEVIPSKKGTDRRSFLKISGLGMATAGLVLTGCSDDPNPIIPIFPVDNQYPGVRNGIFDLGGKDLGILTYAYALEQLEADFYTRVVNDPLFLLTFDLEEQRLLTDIYYHEVIHREFFKAALTGALPDPDAQLLPNLSFNYGALNFSNRDMVLQTSAALEDTGVSAYNGAGNKLVSPDYLTIAGKIVSVEARHAAAIRSILAGNGTSGYDFKSFAGDDVVDNNGLDVASLPQAVITKVKSLGFITTDFTAQFL